MKKFNDGEGNNETYSQYRFYSLNPEEVGDQEKNENRSHYYGFHGTPELDQRENKRFLDGAVLRSMSDGDSVYTADVTEWP